MQSGMCILSELVLSLKLWARFCCEFEQDDGTVVNAESIRRSLGDFTHLERFPARWAPVL